jgi:3-phenylpropionate/cinnamic acid dioxygenase small subunit
MPLGKWAKSGRILLRGQRRERELFAPCMTSQEICAMTIDDQTLAALRVLLDKQAIHEVLMRYCRGIDRCDEELLRSVYHHDATDNHGQFNGKAADFVPWAIKSLRRDERTTHFLCNELIEVEGDSAHCESYLFAVHRRKTKDRTATTDLTFGGRYVDRFERREGHWKIAHRQVVFEWSRLDSVEGSYSIDQFVTGKRSPEDAVYKRG